jgi:hypothetical protein
VANASSPCMLEYKTRRAWVKVTSAEKNLRPSKGAAEDGVKHSSLDFPSQSPAFFAQASAMQCLGA